MGDQHRFVMKHLLMTEIRVFLGLTGWDVDTGNGRFLIIHQNELEFIAIEVVAGRDDPAGFQGDRIDGADGQLERLVGVENPLLRSTAEAIEQPGDDRASQQRQQQYQPKPGPSALPHADAPVLAAIQSRYADDPIRTGKAMISGTS